MSPELLRLLLLAQLHVPADPDVAAPALGDLVASRPSDCVEMPGSYEAWEATTAHRTADENQSEIGCGPSMCAPGPDPGAGPLDFG